jgi:hypothetical protein
MRTPLAPVSFEVKPSQGQRGKGRHGSGVTRLKFAKASEYCVIAVAFRPAPRVDVITSA